MGKAKAAELSFTEMMEMVRALARETVASSALVRQVCEEQMEKGLRIVAEVDGYGRLLCSDCGRHEGQLRRSGEVFCVRCYVKAYGAKIVITDSDRNEWMAARPPDEAKADE